MSKNPLLPFSTLLALVLSSAATLRADVKMPVIFGDHMLLQQEAKLPIWGWAAPDEKVTVTFAGQTASAVAATDGKWRVDLAPVPANGVGQVLTITGKNTLTFQDVLVGDVWIAAGQSNMELGIESDTREPDAIETSNDPQLRLFVVPNSYSIEGPSPDLVRTPPNSPAGNWQVCTPEFLKTKIGGHGFSAAAYYFARDIRHATGKPVGVIASYVGGTPAESWTSLSGLQKDPALANYVEAYQKQLAAYPAAQAAFPQAKVDYQTAVTAWNASDEGKAFLAANAQWNTVNDQAKAAGQTPPPRPPTPKSFPKGPEVPDGGNHVPSTLFNGKIAPLIPYGIKGVIWYQGESNGGPTAIAQEYAILFPRMISDWREKWGEGDFPFIYVQLANFMGAPRSPSEGDWPWVREGQLKALTLPHTSMASAVDIGNPTNIHPTDKLDVGLRLARAARHLAYGEDLVYSGPIYDSMTVEENKIRLTFKNRGSGLVLGVAPWTPTGIPPATPTELTGFGIAGADQKFVWAKAVIDGDTVVVSADAVTAPVAVRYDWANNPAGDLYNKEGLPASPFRTDTWAK
jgi:sialate O-acetylesterase